MILDEYVEDTLDWLTAVGGRTGREHVPRALRAAIRHLDSPLPTLRSHAEAQLRRAPLHHATPLLHRAARSRVPLRAVRAAVLLTQLGDVNGNELLHHLISEPLFREGQERENLRHAARSLLAPDTYIRQATAALAQVEQRPDSCRAIARFRQATEILRFLHAPLPAHILDRALLVRTIGGENLSLVRQVLRGSQGVDVEHVCLVRMQAVLMLLQALDHPSALRRLMQTVAYPNPAVQLTALYGLEILRDPRAINVLLPIAQDERHPIRDDARELLALLGTKGSGALTLLRASEQYADAPDELLRSISPDNDEPHTLLRSTPPLPFNDAAQIVQEIDACTGK